MPKGFSVKPAAQRKRATVSKESHPVEIRVCSTRYQDSKTRRFVSPPKNGGPVVHKARVIDTRYAAGDSAAVVITERDENGERRVKSVKVRDLAGRSAARAKPTKAARRSALKAVKRGEADAGLLELERRGGRVSQDDHNESMAAALKADQTKRAGVSRKRNAAARAASPKAKTDPALLQAQLLKAQATEQAARSAATRAKTDKTRTAHTRRARSAADRVTTLRGQLARLGVKA